jgi:hypothetical protein
VAVPLEAGRSQVLQLVCGDDEVDIKQEEEVDRSDAWIQTFTGRKVWPLDPRPSEIFIEDIAHALALQCRFAGHCQRFYSIAEHSVRVAEACSPENRLWGLLHDAAEAYCCDLPAPLKRLPEMKQFRDCEKAILLAIAEKFKLPPNIPAEVKKADLTLLATEKRDLMVPGPQWGWLPDPLPGRILPLDQQAAERGFLTEFRILKPYS